MTIYNYCAMTMSANKLDVFTPAYLLTRPRVEIVLLLAILGMVYGNDFFIVGASLNQFLLMDYGMKGLILVICLSTPAFRRITALTLHIPKPPWAEGGGAVFHVVLLMAMTFGIMWMAAYVAEVVRYSLELPPSPPYPPYEDNIVKYFDLTLGLLLNSVAEEVFYRGVLLFYLSLVVPRTAVAVIVCSLIFASAHWFQGIAPMVEIFVTGCVLSVLFLATRSLMPGIIVHTAYNLAGLI